MKRALNYLCQLDQVYIDEEAKVIASLNFSFYEKVEMTLRAIPAYNAPDLTTDSYHIYKLALDAHACSSVDRRTLIDIIQIH